MRFTRAHLWAGLLLGATLQTLASSCCPDEPTYASLEDGAYVPQSAACELEGLLITLEDDVVHFDYLADDGHEYRVIYDVVDREWD